MRTLKFAIAILCCIGAIAAFWNWLPLAYTFETMCKKDSGFVSYITPRQWVINNKTSLTNIDKRTLEEITSPHAIYSGMVQYEFFGGLLLRQTKADMLHRYGMDIWRSESRIIDAKSGLPITKRVDYSIGPTEDIRIWLTKQSCFSNIENRPITAEANFQMQIKDEIK